MKITEFGTSCSTGLEVLKQELVAGPVVTAFDGSLAILHFDK